MKRLEDILTPEEWQRLVESRQDQTLFDFDFIKTFGNKKGEVNYAVFGPVHIIGDDVAELQKANPDRYQHLVKFLPNVRATSNEGRLHFVALDQGRRFVLFRPGPMLKKMGVETMYLYRWNDRNEITFSARSLPGASEHGSFSMSINPVWPIQSNTKPQGGRSELEWKLASEGYFGMLTWSFGRDSYGEVAFTKEQWQTLFPLLDAWVM